MMNELDQIESLLLRLRREMLDLQVPAKESEDVWTNQGIGKCVVVINKHLSDIRKEKEYLAFIRDNEELFKELYEGVKDK